MPSKKEKVSGFTVAVKFSGRTIQLCGFYAVRGDAERSARSLRDSWKHVRYRDHSPTSIRVRKVSESVWKANNQIR